MTASFNSLDLNLLRVFDAVMEERSVLRASQKVFLSQSAVSHSLARLREMLDDELFIRTTAGMQPTARALAMAPLVRAALKSLEAAIELPKFDSKTSTRKFTIAANDFTTMVVAPRLLQILSAEAPLVDIAIKPVTRIDLAEPRPDRRGHRHFFRDAAALQFALAVRIRRRAYCARIPKARHDHYRGTLPPLDHGRILWRRAGGRN
jgi:DNA-binding transcriptional LysR family regulator